MTDVLSQIDKRLGDGLDNFICNHHRRRLRRVGWERALQPGPNWWAAGDPPPRKGNSNEVLIDGANAFPRIIEEMRAARSHVHLTGWHLDPDFEIERGAERLTLQELLREVAARVEVRVLLWAGAPSPLVKTGRSAIRHIADAFRDAGAQVALDSKERPLHCHHEKVASIDDRVAVVGGIDATDLEGDRFDSSAHPIRNTSGWHDATTLLRGPIVADVAEHFAMRWHEVTNERLPRARPPEEHGSIEVQLVRTIPEKVYNAVPKGDFRILEAYAGAFAAAQKLIYLENQYLWSPEIVDILAEKLEHPPSPDFRMVMILPSKPNTGYDDTIGQLAQLDEADDAGRLVACTLYARGPAAPQRIYIHAKIGIVDDKWLTIGSANLNEHSLFNDSEVNVITHDPDLARATRLRLWAEHLEATVEEVSGEPTALIDTVWKPVAAEQMRLLEAEEPLTHRLVGLPHVSKRAKRLLGPIQGLFVDG
ncbi:MAG: phospholipase D-like domain-containing protein [Actinomycetota bacterium]|nr:phospholipase D-like domain-containing protein [Actinomycetota bacterium]